MRILQLSDCHLRADPGAPADGSSPDATLLRVVERARIERPDGVVVSGDLADAPDPHTYRRLARLLAPLSAPCGFLPGNHDDPAALADGLGEAAAVGGRWLSWGDLHLALLDSHWPGEAAGRLGARQRSWLERRLHESEGAVAVFLHHPPVAVGSAWLDDIGLSDRTELAALLAPSRHRIVGLFFGHVHQAVRGRLAGIPCFGAPSTWRQFAPCRPRFAYDSAPPGARLIDWDGERLSVRCLWAAT